MQPSETPGAVAAHLRPASPHEVGVAEHVPDMARIAGAHILANEAYAVLVPRGFTERQILAWAETYLDEEHSGDLETFLDWIDLREHQDTGLL